VSAELRKDAIVTGGVTQLINGYLGEVGWLETPVKAEVNEEAIPVYIRRIAFLFHKCAGLHALRPYCCS